LDVEDINASQQGEIGIAKSFYELGEPTNWGIVPRNPAV
jgi:hypothetical protein